MLFKHFNLIWHMNRHWMMCHLLTGLTFEGVKNYLKVSDSLTTFWHLNILILNLLFLHRYFFISQQFVFTKLLWYWPLNAKGDLYWLFRCWWCIILIVIIEMNYFFNVKTTLYFVRYRGVIKCWEWHTDSSFNLYDELLATIHNL